MKFSIRDLLLVTMIAALALGWLLDRTKLAAGQQLWQSAAKKWEGRAEEVLETLELYVGKRLVWGSNWRNDTTLPAPSALTPIPPKK